jgi:hypothetical protein
MQPYEKRRRISYCKRSLSALVWGQEVLFRMLYALFCVLHPWLSHGSGGLRRIDDNTVAWLCLSCLLPWIESLLPSSLLLRVLLLGNGF